MDRFTVVESRPGNSLPILDAGAPGPVRLFYTVRLNWNTYQP